jgi:phosphate transport system substrate-binding protein
MATLHGVWPGKEEWPLARHQEAIIVDQGQPSPLGSTKGAPPVRESTSVKVAGVEILDTRKGVCLNNEKCPLARREEVIIVDHGEPFDCPVCSKPLEEVQIQKVHTQSAKAPRKGTQVVEEVEALRLEFQKVEAEKEEAKRAGEGTEAEPRRRPVAVVLSLALVVIVAAGLIFRTSLIQSWNGALAAHGKVMLRLAGSNTIGGQLMPALAEAYLRNRGATKVYTRTGSSPEVKTVYGTLPGSILPVEIVISARGSTTAFNSLADASCDIGMASRRIKPDEITKLATTGTTTDSASEHVLGLDGIAVIVNSQNPLNEISADELTRIFTGSESRWPNGAAINLYARDDNSGTFDTFKSLVLADKPLGNSAERFEYSSALSDAVAADPGGIGFVGLQYVRNAKALAISDMGSKVLLPTALTVATEDYPLSRRLYLYTPTKSANPNVREFVQFALSQTGQQVVAANGFVAQTTELISQKAAPGAPPEYRNLTATAQRLPINFRFIDGKTDLDSRSLADLDRVVALLTKIDPAKARVLLFGFSDSGGSESTNVHISRDRANAVSNALSRRGVTSTVAEGFGSALPIASNQTPGGREKNRRVEIWIAGA